MTAVAYQSPTYRPYIGGGGGVALLSDGASREQGRKRESGLPLSSFARVYEDEHVCVGENQRGGVASTHTYKRFSTLLILPPTVARVVNARADHTADSTYEGGGGVADHTGFGFCQQAPCVKF